MEQINFDSFMDGQKELIHCELGSDFHWIRITSGHTPKEINNKVQFAIDGYDFMYISKAEKDEALKAFDGPTKTLTWEEAMGYGEPKKESSTGKLANADVSGPADS